MKGYGSRTKPSEGVRQDLYVKALALRDETGATAVLVTSDLQQNTHSSAESLQERADRLADVCLNLRRKWRGSRLVTSLLEPLRRG